MPIDLEEEKKKIDEEFRKKLEALKKKEVEIELQKYREKKKNEYKVEEQIIGERIKFNEGFLDRYRQFGGKRRSRKKSTYTRRYKHYTRRYKHSTRRYKWGKRKKHIYRKKRRSRKYSNMFSYPS